MNKGFEFLFSIILTLFRAWVFSMFFIWFMIPLIEDYNSMNIPIAYGIIGLVHLLIPQQFIQSWLIKSNPAYGEFSEPIWVLIWLVVLAILFSSGMIMRSFI